MKEVKEELGNPTSSRSWVQSVIFVGKTVGGFGLLFWYFITPKPYLACQFATLSLTRGMPGQSQSEVEKEKQGGQLEDARQASSIGTAVESEASESLLIPEEARRTSSSAVSIERRESNAPETSTSSWSDPRPFPLEKITEQEITTFAPPVQEMTTSVAGSPRINVATAAGRKAMITSKGRLISTPVLDRSSGRGPILQSSSSDPGNFHPSESQTSRQGCSPCSDSVTNCCTTTFKSLADRATDHARTLTRFGPSSMVPAIRSASSNEVLLESSAPEWENQSLEDLRQAYFNTSTRDERQDYFLSCITNLSTVKVEELNDFIEHQDQLYVEQAQARSLEIHSYLTNSRLMEDTAPEEGFPEISSRDFGEAYYQEGVPWQLRLVPEDTSRFSPTDIESYQTMTSHTGNITMEHVASQRRQVEACSDTTRKTLEKGRKRLLELAIKNGHMRTLPVILDGRHDVQNVKNIATILKHESRCKLSADNETAALVKAAFDQLEWSWPNVGNTPLSSSLPPNLFSIKRDTVGEGATNLPDINWVSTTTKGGKRQIWPLKVLKKSVEYENGKPTNMFLVNQDLSHVDGHYECYDHDGHYLGKLDKDTMLLYAETIPHEDRSARPKKDVKR